MIKISPQECAHTRVHVNDANLQIPSCPASNSVNALAITEIDSKANCVQEGGGGRVLYHMVTSSVVCECDCDRQTCLV